MEPLSSNVDGGQAGSFAVLERIADGLSFAAALLAAACLVALTGLILAEILLALLARFSTSVPTSIGVAWEYSAYLMGGSFMLGAGMTLRAGQQIRVELLLRARGGKYARYLEMASCAVGALITGFLAYTMIVYAVRSYASGEVSQDSFTALWMPQAFLAVGATTLALQMVVRTAASIAGRTVERPELGAATAIE